MSKLMRNGTAEPVSRDQILRRERRQRILHFPCSAADHEQDWQPCPVVRAIHTNIVLHTHTAVVVRLYFQHAHFIPIVGVGKRGEYQLVHGDLPRQHPFGTTLRFTGPVPADSRQ